MFSSTKGNRQNSEDTESYLKTEGNVELEEMTQGGQSNIYVVNKPGSNQIRKLLYSSIRISYISSLKEERYSKRLFWIAYYIKKSMLQKCLPVEHSSNIQQNYAQMEKKNVDSGGWCRNLI